MIRTSFCLFGRGDTGTMARRCVAVAATLGIAATPLALSAADGPTVGFLMADYTTSARWQFDRDFYIAALKKVDPKVAPLPVYLNVLGMPGMTAYFGLLEVGRAVAGNTVVVSGAAGAVGMTVGQIAKIKGCRVVGIAGGPEKCAYVRDELGFDAAIDYKSEDLNGALREHCPNGIDVYFDNVGGATLDACLARLAMHARVVICGAISQYNNTTAVTGPSNYLSLLVNRATMQGMVVFDYAKRYPEAVREMAGWIAEGKLKSREDVVKGIDTFPETLLKLFRGENFGKLVLEVAAP